MARGTYWNWSRYYWSLLQEIGAETYKTWRWELFLSLLAGVFTAGFGGNWKDFKTAALGTAMAFGCLIVWHIMRSPWLLHRSSEDRGNVWGILGVVVIAGVFIGGMKMGSLWWNSRPTEIIQASIQAPRPSILATIPSKVTPEWKRPASGKEGPFGPIFAVEIVQEFSSIQPCNLRVTWPKDKEQFGKSLEWILTYGAHCKIKPKNISLLDADQPKTPDPRKSPGVTVHWNKSFQEGAQVAHWFDASGFLTFMSNNVFSDDEPDVIWIDIGPGDPWRL